MKIDLNLGESGRRVVREVQDVQNQLFKAQMDGPVSLHDENLRSENRSFILQFPKDEKHARLIRTLLLLWFFAWSVVTEIFLDGPTENVGWEVVFHFSASIGFLLLIHLDITLLHARQNRRDAALIAGEVARLTVLIGVADEVKWDYLRIFKNVGEHGGMELKPWMNDIQEISSKEHQQHLPADSWFRR